MYLHVKNLKIVKSFFFARLIPGIVYSLRFRFPIAETEKSFQKGIFFCQLEFFCGSAYILVFEEKKVTIFAKILKNHTYHVKEMPKIYNCGELYVKILNFCIF